MRILAGDRRARSVFVGVFVGCAVVCLFVLSTEAVSDYVLGASVCGGSCPSTSTSIGCVNECSSTTTTNCACDCSIYIDEFSGSCSASCDDQDTVTDYCHR